MVSAADFPRRGEVWLVRFPGDPKLRPALAVSVNHRNEFGNSVLAVPITTNLKPAPTHVFLPMGQGGLHQNSMARCENVSYVERIDVRRAGFSGLISASLLREIERALLRALGITPT